MIQIDPTKSKEIRFKMEIQGATGPVEARLVMPTKNNYSLVFNSSVVNGVASVLVPPLGEIGRNVIGEARLEVIADNYILVPWTGSFQFVESFSVKSVVVEGESGPSEAPLKGVPKVSSAILEEIDLSVKPSPAKAPPMKASRKGKASEVICGMDEFFRIQKGEG